VVTVLMKPLFAPEDLTGSTLPQPPGPALWVCVGTGATPDAPSAQLGKPQLSLLAA
jgi:hypothetical protein